MFCKRPFEQFYVTSNGDAHLCCPEWIAMPAGNVIATHPLEIWQGKVAQNIRRSILDQSFRHCVACPFLPGPAGCVVDESVEGQPAVDRIGTLTVAYDPTCNLSCPSCRQGIRGREPRSELIQRILLESGIFKIVDRLCSSGSGDPIASPLYWDLLASLPPAEYPHMQLSLQTNGVLLDERARGKFGTWWDRVDEVLVSVDAATPETYALNRRGGNWEKLMRNLDYLAQATGVRLQLNMVVQANNFEEMPSFARLARSCGAHRAYFSALDNWGTYSTSDYAERAVHLPSHPQHARLLEVLRDPDLSDPARTTLARLPRSGAAR
jgi:MoaA/NifB/PqqE/SkfB family radical SAM enzyme